MAIVALIVGNACETFEKLPRRNYPNEWLSYFEIL